MDDAAELHLAVCRRFGEAVVAARGKWDRRSPCEEWDARGVLEHVIGFHDVLLLRPLDLKPTRSRDDPQARWQLTYDALTVALARQLDVPQLLPNLTRDVLVHTWDLARAVGANDRLNPHWCELFCVPDDLQSLSSSGMFKAPLSVPDETDAQARLLAWLGRDWCWRPSST